MSDVKRSDLSVSTWHATTLNYHIMSEIALKGHYVVLEKKFKLRMFILTILMR